MFRYCELKQDMKFNLTYICSTCAYLLNTKRDVELNDVSNICDDLMCSMECSMCSGGTINYTSCFIFDDTLDLGFNANVLRIIDNVKYLEEAYENPSSLNVCTCDKYEAYLALTMFGTKLPFVCGKCTKLFVDPTFMLKLQSEDSQADTITFRALRATQINAFRDYFPVTWSWDRGSWAEPANSHKRKRYEEVDIPRL